MTDKQLLEQVLEALLDSIDDVRDCLNQNLPHAGYARYDRRIEAYREQIKKHEKAIADLTAAIRARLEQPEQKPVAWLCHPFGDSEVEYGPYQQCENCMPLYTTPPAAQPATEKSSAVQPAPVQEPLITDEKGRPMTFWGGKATQPAAQAAPYVASQLVQEPVVTLIDHYGFTDGVVRFDGVENMEQLPIGTKFYIAPPAAPVQEFGLTWERFNALESEIATLQADWQASLKDNQRLTALVRAQQITIEKLEAQTAPVQQRYCSQAEQELYDGEDADDDTTPPAAPVKDCFWKREGYKECPAAQRPVPEERKWVGLTHEEIDKTPCELYAPDQGGMTVEEGLQVYARAIEAKLKEKNT